MALQAFARVVEWGGFTNGKRAIRWQMSKDKRERPCLQSLEKHLGVRLLQRH